MVLLAHGVGVDDVLGIIARPYCGDSRSGVEADKTSPSPSPYRGCALDTPTPRLPGVLRTHSGSAVGNPINQPSRNPTI